MKTILKLCSSALIIILSLPPTACFAEQGYVIKELSGNEILVSNFAVEGVIIEYYDPDGKSGYIAKDLVEDIILIENINTYSPPSKRKLSEGKLNHEN